MKKYIGTKQIEAEPMTMGEAYERGLLQVGRVPDAEYAKRMGYHVKYADGYESWSPAEPFEEAYKLADTSLDRMQIEAEEVNGRYVKLAAFIDSGKMDEVVNDMYNKCLLEMQCCTMFDYIRLLDTRIQHMQGSDGAKVIKMNFGMAIMALKAGYPIRRSGWNRDYLPPHIEEYPKYTPFERVEYNEEFDLTYILLNDGSVAVTDGVFYEKVSKHTWM